MASAAEPRSICSGGTMQSQPDTPRGYPQRTTKPKTLLDLPPELRLEIYDHLFTSLYTNLITKLSIKPRTTTPSTSHATKVFPNLMRTSSVLRNEATPRYRKHLQSLQRETPIIGLGISVWKVMTDFELAGLELMSDRQAEYEARKEELEEEVKVFEGLQAGMEVMRGRIEAVLEVLRGWSMRADVRHVLRLEAEGCALLEAPG